MFQPIGSPQIMNRELSDPNWRKYFDILKNQGVDKLSTAEASGMNDPYSKLQQGSGPGIRTRQPGFFDTQDSHSQQRASLQGLLDAADLNTYGRKRS